MAYVFFVATYYSCRCLMKAARSTVFNASGLMATSAIYGEAGSKAASIVSLAILRKSASPKASRRQQVSTKRLATPPLSHSTRQSPVSG